MSTLAEIEVAVQALPRDQQEELLVFLAEKVGHATPRAEANDDAFARLIGAFAGPADATGRKTEEILYGPAA